MYRIIFQMLFWLGCRVGELLALTSENLSDYGQGNRDAIQKGSWMVMRMVREFYNEQNNIVNVIHYDTNHILSLDGGKWEQGLRITPNSQGKMDALAIEDPVEHVRMMLGGEIQVWLDALDDISVW